MGRCFGGFGVDIFFVISGFIMVYISHNHFAKKGASFSFLERRFVRIFPIYWIISLVTFFILIPSGLYAYAFQNSAATSIQEMKGVSYIVNSFLLLPYFNKAGSQITPIISVGWTLIYEMFFYYVFCLILLCSRKIYLYILFVSFISIIMTQYIINAPFFHLTINTTLNLYLKLYGNAVILEFLFGCVVAELYLRGKIMPNKVSILLILLSSFSFVYMYFVPHAHYYELHGIALLTLFYHIPLLGVGIPSMLLVYSALSLEANNTLHFPTALVKLGNASYSIYLTHFSVFLIILLPLLKQIEAHIYIPGDLAVFIIWALCIPLGYMVYIYVELPLLRLFSGFSFKKIALLIMPKNASTQKEL